MSVTSPSFIKYIPRNRLWLFPFVSGTAWFVTLGTLWIYWAASGFPIYEGQRNPYIAFISDIGAHHLKPLFITGGTLTAMSFIGTLYAVHFARHDTRMYGLHDTTTKRVLSIIALITGILASMAVFFLTIFDTSRYHDIHGPLLLVAFGGLAVSSICTTIVYLDQTLKASEFRRLRLYCGISCGVVLVEICVGIVFTACLWTDRWRTAGILEWTIAFGGCFYIWAFIGFVSVPEEGAIHDRERRPLLSQNT